MTAAIARRGGRGRRRRAVRGLPALPVPRVGAEEPAALAVRGADAGRPTAPSPPATAPSACSSRADRGGELHVRLRCLQLQARSLRTPDGADVDELVVDGHRHLRFEEGVPRAGRRGADRRRSAATASGQRADPAARFARDRGAPRRHGRARRHDRPGVLAGDGAARRLGHRPARALPRAPAAAVDVVNDGTVVNDSACPADASPGEARDAVLRTSLIAAHTVLAARPGTFLSLTDPPQWAEPATAECVNEHTWPVLAGPERPQRPAAVVADHPRRPPAARPGEHDRPLRRPGERRDPHPAHARAHRRGEGRGPGHRPARGRDHRRGRRDAAGDPGAAARGDPLAATGRPDGRAGVRRRQRRTSRTAGTATPWWDPGQDASVDPDTDSVLVGGVPVAKGSRSCCGPAAAATPRTASSTGCAPPCRPWCTTSTAACTSRCRWTATRPPSCSSRTAGSATSAPTSSRPVASEPAAASGHAPATGAGRRRRQRLPLRRRLRRRRGRGLLARGGLPAGVELVDIGIRGMHLAYQLLDGYRALRARRRHAARRGARHRLHAGARPRRPRRAGASPRRARHGSRRGARPARRAGRIDGPRAARSAGSWSSGASRPCCRRASGSARRWPPRSNPPCAGRHRARRHPGRQAHARE